MRQIASAVARAREQLRDDHERLHALLARLRSVPDRTGLTVGLRELHDRLTEHFRREEAPDGLYDAMGVCVPEFRGRVGQLVDDHFRLVSTTRNLAEEALSPRVATEALREQALRVADYLADHEQREHELAKALTEGA
jgi:hypothetical protein